MSLAMFLTTLLECAAVGFIIWGVFNEQKLVAFEDKIRAALGDTFHRATTLKNVKFLRYSVLKSHGTR